MRLLVRFLGFLFAAGAILFVVGAVAATTAIWHFSKDLPEYSQLQDYEPPVMTRVHAADGSLVAEYAKERWGVTLKTNAQYAGTPVSYGRIVE